MLRGQPPESVCDTILWLGRGSPFVDWIDSQTICFAEVAADVSILLLVLLYCLGQEAFDHVVAEPTQYFGVACYQ